MFTNNLGLLQKLLIKKGYSLLWGGLPARLCILCTYSNLKTLKHIPSSFPHQITLKEEYNPLYTFVNSMHKNAYPYIGNKTRGKYQEILYTRSTCQLCLNALLLLVQ